MRQNPQLPQLENDEGRGWGEFFNWTIWIIFWERTLAVVPNILPHMALYDQYTTHI